jgi:hypothetical protein
MGRARKKGLDYFAFDIDFFDDIRTRKLIKHQGAKAISVYTLLLCTIYKSGYYIKWDDELSLMFSDKTGYDEAYIGEVIRCCVNVGLLDKEMFDKGVLTSEWIQDRYSKISRTTKRICAMDEYCLISSEEKPISSEEKPISSEEKPISSEEKPISSEEKPISSEEKPISSEEKPKSQSKEKKKVSKENKENPENITLSEKKKEPPIIIGGKKEKENGAEIAVKSQTSKPLEERKQEFYDSLRQYVGKYDREMLRDFYDYWSESNDGGTKMRWEIAKTKGGTFSIGGRLATWKRNEERYGRNGSGREKGCSISEAIRAAYIPTPGSGFEQIDMTKLLGG